MKSSNRWVMKGMDKSDEEIIASFSKNKMTVFTWKVKKILMTPIDSVVITSPSTVRIDGYGTTNQEYQSLGWRYQLQILSIRPRRTRSKTSGTF
jgi:hypothetical protein